MTSSFSNSQTPMPSSNNSTNFHLITAIPDFTIGFVSVGKEKEDALEKSSSSNVHTPIDSAYNKAKLVNLKKEILHNLKKEILQRKKYIKNCLTMSLIFLNLDTRTRLKNQAPGLMS